MTSYAETVRRCAWTKGTNSVQGSDSGLKELDEKVRSRLEHIRDLVLYRYRSTGVEDAIQRAVDLVGLVPIYPVRSLTNFTCDRYARLCARCVAGPNSLHVAPSTCSRSVSWPRKAPRFERLPVC